MENEKETSAEALAFIDLVKKSKDKFDHGGCLGCLSLVFNQGETLAYLFDEHTSALRSQLDDMRLSRNKETELRRNAYVRCNKQREQFKTILYTLHEYASGDPVTLQRKIEEAINDLDKS